LFYLTNLKYFCEFFLDVKLKTPFLVFLLIRIEKNGGTLLLGRVQGRLGVARSFGDLDFKNSETLEARYITCEPGTGP
jgi:hypothetical protein